MCVCNNSVIRDINLNTLTIALHGSVVLNTSIIAGLSLQVALALAKRKEGPGEWELCIGVDMCRKIGFLGNANGDEINTFVRAAQRPEMT